MYKLFDTLFAAGSQAPDPCYNNLTDCDKYGTSVCSGDYFLWAKDNCKLYCGFCTRK